MEFPTISQLLSNRILWRWLFLLYLAALSVALLWPGLAIPPVMPRPDLLGHCVAFGLFGLLLCLWNPTATARLPVTLAVTLAAGAVYGGTTELLQMVPRLNRSAGWDDWGANLLGVICGLVAFLAVNRWRGSRSAPTPRRADT